MTAPTGAGLRTIAARGRAPVYGLASQLLNAGTNVVTAYIASLLLAPADFGRFVVAFAAVTVTLAAGRGLIGATMLVHLPAVPEGGHAPAIRSALGFTLLAGVGAAAVLVVAGTMYPVLWWFVPWVPIALLHDLGRYVFLASRRTERALLLDVTWAVVQGAVLGLGWLATGSMTLSLVACAWGAGALGGLVVFLAIVRVRPASPAPWVRATRDVAGWFTAVAVLAQAEVYLVLLLTGLLLHPADVGGVRTVQLLAFQPPVVLLAAVLTLLQPTIVRARHSEAALRAAWGRVTLAVTPVIAVLAVLALAREPLMAFLFPRYVDFAPLVVPIALQSTFVAIAVGPLAVLNGLRRGASAFRMELLRACLTAGAAVVGMELGGATGLAWALAAGSASACLQLCLVARRAIPRAVAAAGSAPTARSDHQPVR